METVVQSMRFHDINHYKAANSYGRHANVNKAGERVPP